MNNRVRQLLRIGEGTLEAMAVWKHGDGGAIRDDGKPSALRRQAIANARVVLTVELPKCGGVKTADKSDRAHGVKDIDTGRLAPAIAVANARPRVYPKSQMTSRGVSFDSAFDETHERMKRLESDGLVKPQRFVSAVEQLANAGIRPSSFTRRNAR